MQSLLTQGEIIAGAIAASATVDTDTITIDPDKLLQMQAGETERLGEEGLSPLEFSINPERVAPLLRRLVTPTRTRARIYDREGVAPARFARPSTPAATSCASTCRRSPKQDASFIERVWNAPAQPLPPRRAASARRDRPGQRQDPAGGAAGPRRRDSAPYVRRNERGETIVSVAVPIQRFRFGARRAPRSRPRAATSTASSPRSASRCCRSSSSRPS